MNIAEIIAALTGGTDPNAAVMNAQGAMPPSGPPPQQAAGPQPNAPVGIKTPVTNPQPSGSAPTATQSPPDLANMYVALMKQNQNAQALDSGMTLMAAGLSRRPETRQALIQAASGGGSRGGMTLSGGDIVNMQKAQQDQQNQLIRRQALPALMKQYGWTQAQAQALEAGGKLDEVLQNYATAELGSAEDKENGQTILFSKRTGKPIARLGGEKPEDTQIVEGPNGPELRSKEDFRQIGAAAGLKPDQIVVSRQDGSQFVADKAYPDKPIRELAPREKIGDKITPSENELNAINVAREARGEKPLTPEELIKLKQHPGVTVNTGKGADLPFQPPEKGFEYERDADGKIIVDPVTRRPTQYEIKGGGPAKETDAAALKLSKEDAEKAKKEAKKKTQEAVTASNTGANIAKAFGAVDKWGASGVGSKLARSVDFLGGGPWADLDSALESINATTAFEQLKHMRESSASGASGLGQVTERENKMLAAVITDLRANQSTEGLKKGLARVQASMELLAGNSYDGKENEFNTDVARRAEEILLDRLNKDPNTKSKIRRLD